MTQEEAEAAIASGDYHADMPFLDLLWEKWPASRRRWPALVRSIRAFQADVKEHSPDSALLVSAQGELLLSLGVTQAGTHMLAEVASVGIKTED